MPDQSNLDASMNLVSVGNFPDNLSAESVRSCLEMDGVTAYVFDGEISSMQGWYTNAFSGVKVMVAKSDEERAVAILSSSQLVDPDGVVSMDEEISPEGSHCRFCHSQRLRTRETWNLPKNSFRRLMTRFLNKTIITTCQTCGKSVRV